MSAQRVREKIERARVSDNERNRLALAKLKASMMLNGDFRLERQIDEIVELILGVAP